MDREAREGQTRPLEKPADGLGGDVALVAGQEGQRVGDIQRPVLPLRQGHGVAEGDRLHHHPHIVVAVAPPSQDVQRQIQFGKGRFSADHRNLRRVQSFSLQ